MTSAPWSVNLTVNGEAVSGVVEPRRTLADFLREDLALTGTHLACEHGVCGSCTVLVDGATARSCLMLAVQADGRSVQTIEGVGTVEHLHPVQQGFYEQHAFQCGYCTPGVVMTTVALLAGNAEPSEDEVRDALSGNLCRCTGYQSIVDGVLCAARLVRGETLG